MNTDSPQNPILSCRLPNNSPSCLQWKIWRRSHLAYTHSVRNVSARHSSSTDPPAAALQTASHRPPLPAQCSRSRFPPSLHRPFPSSAMNCLSAPAPGRPLWAALGSSCLDRVTRRQAGPVAGTGAPDCRGRRGVRMCCGCCDWDWHGG